MTFNRDPNDEPALHTYALVDSEPDLAVVRMPLPVDSIWWISVRDDVLFREYEYRLEQAAAYDGADVLKPGTEEYDPTKVMTWCKERIQPPTWKWFTWQQVTEDELWDDYVTHSLTISLIPRQGWWLGALVTMKGTS